MSIDNSYDKKPSRNSFEEGSGFLSSLIGEMFVHDTFAPELYDVLPGRGQELSFLDLEQPRGTKIVDMNEYGHVTANRGERQRIATFGLGGCTAVGVVATFADGSRRAHVQHYDPFAKRFDEQTPGLEEVVLGVEAESGCYHEATQVAAVIMVSGHGITMEPDNPKQVEHLKETIASSFGEDASITVAPYSLAVRSGESPYVRALVIDIPEDRSPEIFPGLMRVQMDE